MEKSTQKRQLAAREGESSYSRRGVAVVATPCGAFGLFEAARRGRRTAPWLQGDDSGYRGDIFGLMLALMLT